MLLALGVALLSFVYVLTAAAGIRMVRGHDADYLGGDGLEASKTKDDGLFVRLLDAVGLRGQRLLRQLYGQSRLRSLDRRLKNAGNPEGLTLDLFIQREAGFLVLSAVIFVLMLLLGHPYIGATIALIFSGWMYLWLAQAVRKRQNSVNRDLPDFLEVLAVTVRSGIPFRSALERVCDYFDGPVAEEMRMALHQMRLGVARRDAFAATRERCRSENVDVFVGALLQSEELGTPIGDALSSIVREIRRTRAQQVLQAAGKAQPKVALIATVTMVPGTMILMIGGFIFANRDVLAKILGG